jgi:4,5-dihydroxyphthalate decarboxylase
MTTQTITLACRDYDHTRPLADGRIKIDGVDLKFVNISPPSQIFLRMLHDEEFAASEMSLSNYMIALGKNDRRFIAIPVFPSRVFRQAYIWINTRSGIQRPQDLKGKRIGIADYSMTALLFVRGFLQHQYGVMPQDVHWFRRRSEHVSIEIPAGVRLDNISKNQSLDDLLEAGDLDAVALTSPPRGFLKGVPEIKRLFANARAVEAEYYRQTKIFPIMHMVVIRRRLRKKSPPGCPSHRGIRNRKAFVLRRLCRRIVLFTLGTFRSGICSRSSRRRFLSVRCQQKSSDVRSRDVVFK